MSKLVIGIRLEYLSNPMLVIVYSLGQLINFIKSR